MTKEELLDLLREAHKALKNESLDPYLSESDDLLNRIDAALAARQDSATDVVESGEVTWAETLDARVKTATLSCGTHDWRLTVGPSNHGQWVYYTNTYSHSGYRDTEAEAKSAAIAAARGMR